MKWVCVATAPNEPIGESWAELLRERGVPAYVTGEAVMKAYLGAIIPVRVMVPADRETEGRRLLEDLLGPDESPPEEMRG